MFRVYMLGHFAMLSPKGEVILPTNKVRVLTAYLFWQKGNWIKREALQNILWEEADQDHASGSLRTALHSIRRALAEYNDASCILDIRRDTVRIPSNADCWIDAKDFEENAIKGLKNEPSNIDYLMSAVSLYRGHFLEDMDFDWCVVERQRLNVMYIGVLKKLVESLTNAKLYEAALTYAQYWLNADSLNEAAHQALMKLYAIIGQPKNVIEQFEYCKRLLKDELGISPSKETIRLFQELGHGKHINGFPRSQKNSANQNNTNYDVLPIDMISGDPLRNVTMLLAYGEEKALREENLNGISLMEKALSKCKKIHDLAAKAKLALGETMLWLSIILIPNEKHALRLKAMKYINEALDYYKANGCQKELKDALFMASAATWVAGNNNKLAELAKEGLNIAHASNDRESEARFYLLLGMSFRELFQLEKAQEAFNQAIKYIPYVTNLWEMIWIIFQRAIFSYSTGELGDAESFLREALNFCRIDCSNSIKVKVGECTTRSMLIVVLHYKNRMPTELIELVPRGEMTKYVPEPFRYLNTLYTSTTGRVLILQNISSWLRTRIYNLSSPVVAYTIRSIIEEMMSEGMNKMALQWASVGIRLGRARQWHSILALFYCYRAVILSRQGHSAHARICLSRALRTIDRADAWVPAWIARAEGTIAWAEREFIKVEKYFNQSIQLFDKIGDEYDSGQVKLEINKLKNIPAQ
ncbi:MAG: hypothetical protein HPY74_11310 [Firmicutes bacterium]|nr:hypothetical protein [Bacillota bacterium]